MASLQDLNTIANDPTFQGRCMQALELAAVNVAAEGDAVAGHAQRAEYAKAVLAGEVTAPFVAKAVLTNAAIAAEANAQQLSTGAAIPDGDIQFAINSLYNDLAGIIS
jgi:hypothetical protein